MDRTLKWAALLLVAYLLWKLVLSKRFAAAAAPSVAAGSAGGAGVGGGGKPTPAPLTDPGKLPPPSTIVDVAFDVQNGDVFSRDFMADDVQFNKELPMWTDFMQPAGRVRLFADCTRDTWNTMFSWLALSLNRQITRSRRWQLYNSNIAGQQVGQTVDSIVGGVVSTIAGIIGGPVVAALLKYAINAQVQDLQTAIMEEGAVIDFVARMRQSANPAKLPPSVVVLCGEFSNGLVLGDPAATATKLVRALNMNADDANAIGIEDPCYNSPPQPWHKPDGSKYWFPSAWFMLTQVGLYSPWVSAELIGADWNATVNLRARMARCLDYFCTLVAPVAVGSVYGRYWYRNAVYGDVLGSCFPPTSEDSNYIDAAGNVYNFDGSIKVKAGAIAAAAQTAFVPPVINVPGVVPTGAAASSGTGEIFTSAPPPPPPPPVKRSVGGVIVTTGGKAHEISLD